MPCYIMREQLAYYGDSSESLTWILICDCQLRDLRSATLNALRESWLMGYPKVMCVCLELGVYIVDMVQWIRSHLQQ